MIKNDLFKENETVSAKDLLKKEINMSSNTIYTQKEEQVREKLSTEMTFEEYLSYAKGRDIERSMAPNSTILTTHLMFSGKLNSDDINNENLFRVASQRQITTGAIDVHFLPNGYANLDICFPTSTSPELTVFLEQLKDFYLSANSYCLEENTKELPMLQIAIMPLEFVGESYIVFENPIMHALTAEKPAESSSLNIIRLIFKHDDISVIPVSDADANEALEEIAYVNRLYSEEENSYCE